MFKSLKIGKLFGVDIKIHWSWLLMFILFIDFTDPIDKMLTSALTVIMIFTCVLVHEFGHIFAARRYGLQTSKVVLSFLGGAAIMDEGLDTLSPKRALWVAFAGPLTNIIMFVILFPFAGMVLDTGAEVITAESLTNGQFLYLIALIVNVMMVLFNLLPIYPMDGGRLLRSTLELFKVKHSFLISVRITQIFCAAIIVFGLYIGSWTMPLIGALFFFTAIMELRKKKDDEEFQKVKDELTEDIKRKINWQFDTNNMEVIDKLVFLNELEIKAYETNDERIIKHVKEITDEFRQDIARA